MADGIGFYRSRSDCLSGWVVPPHAMRRRPEEGVAGRADSSSRLVRRNEEDHMRKLLLASAAAMGASMSLVGMASAQTAPALPPGPLSGSFVTAPYAGPGANNNNNYQGYMLPGAIANPTPGSFVVHLNAASWFYLSVEGSSADKVNPGNTGIP